MNHKEGPNNFTEPNLAQNCWNQRFLWFWGFFCMFVWVGVFFVCLIFFFLRQGMFFGVFFWKLNYLVFFQASWNILSLSYENKPENSTFFVLQNDLSDTIPFLSFDLTTFAFLKWRPHLQRHKEYIRAKEIPFIVFNIMIGTCLWTKNPCVRGCVCLPCFRFKEQGSSQKW